MNLQDKLIIAVVCLSFVILLGMMFMLRIKEWIKMAMALSFGKKSLFMIANLNRQLELHAITKVEEKVIVNDVMYIPNPKRIDFIGKTPVYFFTYDNPEQLDMHNETQLDRVTGSYLKVIYDKIIQAVKLEWIDNFLKNYGWIIFIVGIIVVVAIAYFIMFGLTPQIAAGAKAPAIL